MTESDDALPCSASRIPRTRRTRSAVLALLTASVLVGAPVWWFNRSPTLLGTETAMGFTFAPHPVEAAAAAVSLAIPDARGDGEETLTFQSASAHFATNTARSQAVVAICRPRRGQTPIGAVAARDVSTYCDRVLPIRRGTTMSWAEGRPADEYLILILTPTTTGFSRVDRVSYTYARDWRHGHQHGTDVTDGVDVGLRATG